MPESDLENIPASVGDDKFHTTHWSVVLRAGRSESDQAHQALEHLCRAYWYPLYAYVRRCGHDAEESKDLTQEFFARLLAKRQIGGVDPTKGKFRSWLLGVMKHFLAQEWRKLRAQKRGSGQPTFSFDGLDPEERYLLEPTEAWNAEKAFDRRWALTVLENAASRLREEYNAAGKAELFRRVKDFVSMEGTTVTYAEVARQLSLRESAVKSAIYRLRQRYQELVREEIAQTVTNPSEVVEEIRYLLAIVRE